MSSLVLDLRSGETMIINGTAIRFLTKSRIELPAKARVLFGKKIMSPEQADTPARRIYFAIQSAYIGDDERIPGLEAARELIAAFKKATTSQLARDILDKALAAAEGDDCYRALKLTLNIIRHEDAVVGRNRQTAGETPLTTCQAETKRRFPLLTLKLDRQARTAAAEKKRRLLQQWPDERLSRLAKLMNIPPTASPRSLVSSSAGPHGGRDVAASRACDPIAPCPPQSLGGPPAAHPSYRRLPRLEGPRRQSAHARTAAT
jgi:flagellar protein FlbT